MSNRPPKVVRDLKTAMDYEKFAECIATVGIALKNRRHDSEVSEVLKRAASQCVMPDQGLTEGLKRDWSKRGFKNSGLNLDHLPWSAEEYMDTVYDFGERSGYSYLAAEIVKWCKENPELANRYGNALISQPMKNPYFINV